MTEPAISNRGFAHFEPIADRIEVYESSNALVPSIWIKLLPLYATDMSLIDGGIHDARGFVVDLPLRHIDELIDQLTWLRDHHYQVASR